MIGATGTLVLIACAGFASSASMRILEPILPPIGREFSRTADEVAMLSVAFTLVYAGSQLVLGPIGDARGKLRVVLVCLAAVGATTIAAAWAGSFPALLALRVLAGMFAGGIIPLCIALYGDLVPFAERQVMLARFMIASVTGQMIGSAMSGLLAASIGWRGVLVVAGVFGLAAAAALAVVAWRLPEKRKPLSMAGALEGYGQVLANARALPLFAVVCAEGMLIYGLFPYIAAILEHQSGAGPTEAGLVIAGFGIGGVVFGLAARPVIGRLGLTVLAWVGGGLMSVVLLLFAAAAPWPLLACAFAFYGFGFYCLHSTLQTQATELSSASRASGLALFAASLFIGIAAGPIVFGALARNIGDSGALLTFGVATLALAVVAPRALRLG